MLKILISKCPFQFPKIHADNTHRERKLFEKAGANAEKLTVQISKFFH